LRFTARFSAFVSTPKDFVFQISEDEWKNLRDQIGTSSLGPDIAAACGQLRLQTKQAFILSSDFSSEKFRLKIPA
jgi:hypothetical protein